MGPRARTIRSAWRGIVSSTAAQNASLEERGGGLPRSENEEGALVSPHDPVQNGWDDFPIERESIPVFRRERVIKSFNITRETQRSVAKGEAAVILTPADQLRTAVGVR